MKKAIGAISVSVLLLGLLLAIKFVIWIIFFNYHIQDAEMKFVFVLIGAGLVGSVLNSVLKKVVKKFIKKYVTPDKLKETVYELAEEKKAEDDQNTIIESTDVKDINTVIVAVTYTYNQVKNSLEYRCPANYIFKNALEYIAFYKDKKIIGYGRIVSDYQSSVDNEKVFRIESFIDKVIPRQRKGAFIQNKKYCTIESLKHAKTTDDIKPNNLFS